MHLKIEVITNMTKKLSTIFEDAVTASRAKKYKNKIEEEEKQNAVSPKDKSDEQKNEPVNTQAEPSKTHIDNKEKIKSNSISPLDIIEKLNMLRAGRSFRDRSIKQNLEKYVNSLNNEEKRNLLAFLTGLTEIASGIMTADQATIPDTNSKEDESKNTNKEKQFVKIQPTIVQNKKEPVQGNKGPVNLPVRPKS